MPGNKKPTWNVTSLRFYQRIIALRNRHASLRRGDYRTIRADGKTGVFGFTRRYGHDFALALFNRSDSPAVVQLGKGMTGGRTLTDWLGAAGNKVGARIVLPPRGYALLGSG